MSKIFDNRLIHNTQTSHLSNLLNACGILTGHQRILLGVRETESYTVAGFGFESIITLVAWLDPNGGTGAFIPPSLPLGGKVSTCFGSRIKFAVIKSK